MTKAKPLTPEHEFVLRVLLTGRPLIRVSFPEKAAESAARELYRAKMVFRSARKGTYWLTRKGHAAIEKMGLEPFEDSTPEGEPNGRSTDPMD